MEENAIGLWTYLEIVTAASVIGHICIRRFWITCGVVPIVCSVVNLAFEVAAHANQIRPKDVAFWIPAMFILTAALALPVVVTVGLPFYFYRRSRKPI